MLRPANYPQPPTRIELMRVRYAYLQQTVEGFRRTGVPLVAIEGTKFAPAEHGDDAGLFYIVPAIAHALHLNLATDEIAIEKVHSLALAAAYLSPQYEKVLEREVFRLVKEHPSFVFRTLSAKFGVVLALLLIRS